MAELFNVFPYLENDKLIIRKMESSDVVALLEISNRGNVYKYIPPFLDKKSNKTLEIAIYPWNLALSTIYNLADQEEII